MIGEIGLIQRAPLMDPPFKLGKIEAAHPPARRLHDVEDRDMGMHLHIAGRPAFGTGQRVHFRDGQPLFIIPDISTVGRAA